MRKNKGLIFITLLYLSILFSIIFSTSSYAFTFAQETKYYLGGQVAGFVLEEEGATILSITDIFSDNGIYSPGEDAGLKERDKILSINGEKIENCNQVDSILKNYKKGILLFEIERNGEKVLKEVTPVKDVMGKYKLGLIIRDAITGIGTVTYVNSNGEFSALGHPVNEGDSIYKIKGGKIYDALVVGIKKSKRGQPGEIKGFFTETKCIGSIYSNKENGIKGEIKTKNTLKEIKIGKAEMGNATIYCCLQEDVIKEYSISIIKCDYNNKQNKNFVIKITDDDLIKKTGGIIQGMSGSPIVQNGKLVGAVTHVFVNDPTKGYGICIDNLIGNN